MKTLPILNSMLVLASGAGLSAQQANAQQKPQRRGAQCAS